MLYSLIVRLCGAFWHPLAHRIYIRRVIKLMCNEVESVNPIPQRDHQQSESSCKGWRWSHTQSNNRNISCVNTKSRNVNRKRYTRCINLVVRGGLYEEERKSRASYLGENITNYNWIMVKVTIVLWLIVMKDLVNVSYMTLISFRTASKKLAKDIPFSS